MKYYYCYKMLNGQVLIAEQDGGIVQVSLHRTDSSETGFSGEGREQAAGAERMETPLIAKAARELEEYLQGRRQSFDIPQTPRGTPFQQRVWQALRDIPYGETRSYGEIARAAGSPKGARAVGMACNRNPNLILTPCHRVVGSSGDLTGFGGGLDVKEVLLKLENAMPEKKKGRTKNV